MHYENARQIVRKRLSETSSELLDPPIHKFSDNVNDALRISIQDVPPVPFSIQFVMDTLDAATKEVAEELYEAGVYLASAQKRMRAIQKEFVEREGLKITQAERLYKADPAHSELEALCAELDAYLEYGKSVRTVLSNKYFALSHKLRNGE